MAVKPQVKPTVQTDKKALKETREILEKHNLTDEAPAQPAQEQPPVQEPPVQGLTPSSVQPAVPVAREAIADAETKNDARKSSTNRPEDRASTNKAK